MRLYHSRFVAFFVLMLLVAGCSSPQATQAVIQVSIAADGRNIPLQLAAGNTVQQALEVAKIALVGQDRIEPPSYTLLTDGAALRVVRV